MARLCVLREDLYIEIKGIHDDPSPLLDECSTQYRQIYFFRNLLRTMSEIISAFGAIRLHKSFMAEVFKQHPRMKSELARIARLLHEAQAQINIRRNEIGGHVLHSAIQDGLPKIPADARCMLQTGCAPSKIHYKFALEFIGATMLRHVPLSSAKEERRNIFTNVIDLGFEALDTIDTVFHSYARIRDLSLD